MSIPTMDETWSAAMAAAEAAEAVWRAAMAKNAEAAVDSRQEAAKQDAQEATP